MPKVIPFRGRGSYEQATATKINTGQLTLRFADEAPQHYSTFVMMGFNAQGAIGTIQCQTDQVIEALQELITMLQAQLLNVSPGEQLIIRQQMDELKLALG